MRFPPAEPLWQRPALWFSFLGAVAAGSFALACLSTIFGTEADRSATRSAYHLAFPLTAVCILLSWSLRPALYESAALGVFGVTSFGSWCGALGGDGVPGFSLLAKTVRARIGTAFAAWGLAVAVAFGLTSGRALTNGWDGPAWPCAVLLASAGPAGVSAVVLMNRWRCPGLGDEAVERLGRVNGVAVVVELAALAGLSLSVKGPAGLGFLGWPGMLIPLFVVPVGLIVPLIVGEARGARGETDVAALVLIGGFVLRVALSGFHDPLTFR